MAGTAVTQETTCLARTCLKWTADGELSAEDRTLVLERLQRVDGSPIQPPQRQPHP